MAYIVCIYELVVGIRANEMDSLRLETMCTGQHAKLCSEVIQYSFYCGSLFLRKIRNGHKKWSLLHWEIEKQRFHQIWQSAIWFEFFRSFEINQFYLFLRPIKTMANAVFPWKWPHKSLLLWLNGNYLVILWHLKFYWASSRRLNMRNCCAIDSFR